MTCKNCERLRQLAFNIWKPKRQLKPTVTLNNKPLIWNGKPLTAQDIPVGAVIDFDPLTGEVLNIRPEKPKGDNHEDCH
jgi:hypothetical protein